MDSSGRVATARVTEDETYRGWLHPVGTSSLVEPRRQPGRGADNFRDDAGAGTPTTLAVFRTRPSPRRFLLALAEEFTGTSFPLSFA